MANRPVFGGRSRRWVAAAVGVAALISISGCQGSKAEAKPDVKSLSTTKKVDCDFDNADRLANKPTCYEVSVPEDWSNPDKADQVVLPVAVFHATDTTAAAKDPVIYFEGGPGGAALDGLAMSGPMLVKPYVGHRDVIIFDQRGTGRSEPSLICDEQNEVDLASAKGEIAKDDLPEATLNATKDCYERLSADGVNFAAYNSVASSHDVDAIRVGLGYKQLNVLGISYGTRLAQTYMRLYPSSLRSVVIDSVLPVGANLDEEGASSGAAALKHLFEACAADAECAAKYPNFEADYFKLLDQLDAKPVTLELTDPDGGTFSSDVDGDEVLYATFMSLYNKAGFTAIPQMVAQSLDGNYALLTALIDFSLEVDDTISRGMSLSVNCHEEEPFESAEAMKAAVPTEDGYSRFAVATESPTIFEACEIWQAGKAPDVENQPVKSDIPTLLLTGSFDPITPPENAREVAEYLPNSYLFEFPTEGHGVAMTECGAQIADQFLNDPKKAPDASCIDEISAPAFVSNTGPIVLVPFTVTEPLPYSGVRPEGWDEQAAGVFAREGSGFGQAVVGVFAVGGAPTEQVLGFFTESFEIDSTPDTPTTVDGQPWETFDGDAGGFPVRVMVSPGNMFVVLITGPGDEFDDLVTTVAIPVAASLKTQ